MTPDESYNLAAKLSAMLTRAQKDMNEADQMIDRLKAHTRQTMGLDPTGTLSKGWSLEDIPGTPFQIKWRDEEDYQILHYGEDITEWIEFSCEIAEKFFIDSAETLQSQRDDLAFDSAGDR